MRIEQEFDSLKEPKAFEVYQFLVMAKAHEVAKLVRIGKSISQIAVELGNQESSVISYLCRAVGEGYIRSSDIYFSWSNKQREFMSRSSTDSFPSHSDLKQLNLTSAQVKLFLQLKNRRILRKDMYEMVSEFEVILHRLVYNVLEQNYGNERSQWWTEGVPLNIRQKCRSIQEEEGGLIDEPYCYTTLLDLVKIISKNWELFEGKVRTNYEQKKKQLISDLEKLNSIRNRVMHPVKEGNWDEKDFQFVRSMFCIFAELDLDLQSQPKVLFPN